MRAIAALGLGALIAVLTATSLIHLVRTVLRYGCEYLVGGEAGDGSWACPDGIGYMLPGISLAAPVFLGAVAGVVLTFVLRAHRARRIALGLSAIVPIAWAFIWTLGAAQVSIERHPDSIGVWASAVFPSLLVALAGALVLAVTPVRSALGEGVVLGIGLVLFLVAVVVQPGLTSVAAVSAAFAVASTRPATGARYVLTQKYIVRHNGGVDVSLGISPDSAVPPFEQLRTQILDAVTAGKLVPGSRLPTVRRLAGDLGIAAGTVARAYRELEASGVIETRGRNGTFVSPHGDAAHREAQLAASAFAERMRALRIDGEEALALVAAALRNAN